MPTRTRTRPPRRTRPRATRAPIVVAWFTARAARHLKDEVSQFDGHERAGGLFGRRVGNALVVEAVGHPSATVESSRTSTAIDIAQCEALERAFNFEWVGTWHTHPTCTGPSDLDLRSAASHLNGGTGSWLTVIVVPDEEEGFSGSYSRSPGVISYVTSRGADRQVVHRKVGGGAFAPRSRSDREA
jgi:proteasome lid subunit RPN8/RPN11